MLNVFHSLHMEIVLRQAPYATVVITSNFKQSSYSIIFKIDNMVMGTALSLI